MPHTKVKRILYVEDDEALARLLQRRMERRELAVELAPSAEDALKRLARESYDLLLVDYNLPGMNGIELLDKVTAMKGAPPVIILTAGGDERVALTALEKGAADYAVKDTGQTYLDLLPVVMQAAYTRERLLRENERQRRELELAKEKAESANQAKTNFLATMSHEIRTPMNVVTGLAEILSRSNLDANQRKLVDTLRTNADLLLKLINDLLDISRIEAGQIQLEETSFSLSAILDNIRIMFASAVEQKHLTFRLSDKTGGGAFLGDRTRIQQILMNLVGNAIKFTESGEIGVTVDAQDEGDKARITLRVSDSGVGIPADKQTRIFEKFTQADETITRRFGGSGLGLSITRSLANLMGGTVAVESEPGMGSTFTVTILLTRDHAAKLAAPTEISSVTPSVQGSGKVLIVEDYAPNVMVASMMIEDLGYTTESADSGSAAIEKICGISEPYLAILMDVQMQDMDGLETTRRIRELERKRGIRHTIIGVTAHALAGDRERCITAGMDDYMSKPIHPDILAAKLQQLRVRAA